MEFRLYYGLSIYAGNFFFFSKNNQINLSVHHHPIDGRKQYCFLFRKLFKVYSLTALKRKDNLKELICRYNLGSEITFLSNRRNLDYL